MAQQKQHFTTQRYASAVPARLGLCLCLSVTSRSFIKTDEWIELIFGLGDPFDLSYTALKEKSGISQITASRSGTLFKTLEFVDGRRVVAGRTQFIIRQSAVMLCLHYLDPLRILFYYNSEIWLLDD